MYYRLKVRNALDYKKRCHLMFINAKNRAISKSRGIEITTGDVISLWDSQGGRCALTGVEFQLERLPKGVHRNCPSLDRIDSSKGYLKDNIRLVTYHVNTALSNFGEEALLELAQNLINSKGN
jgi:hypothetical protein